MQNFPFKQLVFWMRPIKNGQIFICQNCNKAQAFYCTEYYFDVRKTLVAQQDENVTRQVLRKALSEQQDREYRLYAQTHQCEKCANSVISSFVKDDNLIKALQPDIRARGKKNASIVIGLFMKSGDNDGQAFLSASSDTTIQQLIGDLQRDLPVDRV